MNDTMQAQQQLMQAIQNYQMGDLKKAEDELLALQKSFPKSDQVISILAMVLFGQKRHKEAYRHYRDALKLNPQNAEAAIGIASVEHARGNTDNAIVLIKNALKDFPERVEAHFNLGTFYIERDALTDAEACFLKCLQLQPQLPQADLHLVNIYKELGDLDKTEHYLKKLIAVNADPQLKAKLKEVQEMRGGASEREEPVIAVVEKEAVNENVAAEENKSVTDVFGVAENDLEGLLSLGSAFFERHQYLEATEYYEKVLALDPENETAQFVLRKIKSSSVPTWHFEMLADRDRNDAYQQAIERALAKQPGARVLDIGTGSGLLAMMAARAGASEVLACEMNTELAKVADQVVAANGYKDRIKVLNKKSSDLKQGLDYEGQYDIVVSEILDVAGIGEGVLPSLRHAYESILKQGAVTVPSGMTMYAQLVSVPAFYTVNPIRGISGFDLSAFNMLRSPEEYTPVRLNTMEYELLSEPEAYYSFDFANIPESRDPSNPHAAEVAFKVTEPGKVQAVVFWFELHLDEELTLSSGLGGKLKHWGQALCFMDEEIAVSVGDTVSMMAYFVDFTMWFEPND